MSELANYETLTFPSTTDLSQSAVDRFADLTDSFRVTSVLESQIAFAAYYNKLSLATTELQKWFTFVAASPSSSGTYGEPIYAPSCPVASTTLGTSGDASVSALLKPYVYQRNLADIRNDFLSGITTGVSGNCLPFEVVITSEEFRDYTNHPSAFLTQDSSFWDTYIDGKEVLISAWLTPSFTSPQYFSTMTDLLVSCFAIRTTTHFLIRGFVHAIESAGGGEIFGTTAMQGVILNVSLTSITT